MSEYEFSAQDHDVISSLARRLRLIAVLIFLGGVGSVVRSFQGEGVLMLIEGIVFIIMAVFFYLPSDHFKRIANTTGKEIRALMITFSEINRGWMIVNIITAMLVVVRIGMLIQVILKP